MRIFGGRPRSPKWTGVRRSFLTTNPFCAGCGNATKEQLEVHHIYPYHLPGGSERELDKTNLITLCVGSAKCHFVLGHLLSWNSWNKDVIMDAERFYKKVESRPGK